MSQRCNYRYCDRVLDGNVKANRNKVYTHYCSFYCHEANFKGMKPIRTHCDPPIPQYTYKDISKCCYVCGEEYSLKYECYKSNQRFCGTPCYQKVLSHKNGHRDFFLLCLLKERGNMTANELAEASGAFLKNASRNGIGSIMKVWRARGVIKAIRDYPNNVKRAYRYHYISELLPGQLIETYCSKRFPKP